MLISLLPCKTRSLKVKLRQMTRKNTFKVDVEEGYYHVYNRGVEKRTIFQNEQDYKVFLKYLKEYLTPPPEKKILKRDFTVKDTVFKGIPRQPKNYYKEIELSAYCLMPNHIHLLIKQKSKGSMKEFLHSLLLRYSMYFNKKYDRVGPLFQGRYKAVLITKDPYLLHLSRYIHLNPLDYTGNLVNAYSSYANYLGLRKTSWLKSNMILSFFDQATLVELKKVNSYQDFVEKYKKDSAKILGELTLD